jgi:hypothetical protein
MKVLYTTLLYFTLVGAFVPSFGEFYYYFKTNIVGFSQFTFSMLTLLGAVMFFVSMIIYKTCLTGYETRTLTKVSIFISGIGSVFTLMFVLRWNLKLGIPDLWFVIFTSTIADTVAMAFAFLPP